MKRKVHVVPHSHWDREWYFTTSRSKVYLMKDLKDVLDTLESNPDFKYFMVDAQGSLLDDYIKWMPQDKDRITKLVKEKKLVIGPWYTQTDQLVISGESIVRNMYYGMKRCETFGGYMNVGYVPDSFGQSGNMPQIYKEFGIDDTLFWRGVSDDMVNHTDYNWRGDDGSVVFLSDIILVEIFLKIQSRVKNFGRRNVSKKQADVVLQSISTSLTDLIRLQLEQIFLKLLRKETKKILKMNM